MRGYTSVRGRAILNSTLIRDWRCGICESRLKEVWELNAPVVVCGKNWRHDRDGLITIGTLERRIHNEMVQAETLNRLEREGNMALKDRDEGGLPRRVRLNRIGNIRQGKMVTNPEGKDYPIATNYFIIDPATRDERERDEIIADVRAAIEKNAPPQNLDEPTVLPIRFMASDDEIISPEAYKKRRGDRGTVWCLGDGEYIQWKLTDDFKVEIASGEPQKECPGGERDPEKRHDWCDDCHPEVELNFSILGYERTGTWMLRTKGMGFRDQFRTTMVMAREMINGGIVPGIANIPFLLRRKEEIRLVPTKSGKLISRAMPDTTIEIEPKWFREQMQKQRTRQLAAPEQVSMLGSGDDDEIEGVVSVVGSDVLPGVSFREIDDWNENAEFWPELIRQAQERLGYANEEDVKSALRALFGDVQGAAEYKPEDIWQMLQEHKMMPQQEDLPF